MAFTGVLGSIDGSLGDFALGRASPPPPSNDLEPSVLSDLVITQTLALNKTLNLSISSTLAFTQYGGPPLPKTAIVGYPAGQVRYAYAIDITDNQPLYALNEDDLCYYPASTTKIMTALLLMEYKGASLGSTLTVTSADTTFALGGISTLGYTNGDITTWGDLLTAILVASASEACQAAARLIGTEIYVAAGSTGTTGMTRFYERMNARAAELGMTNAVYYDSWGESRVGGVNVRNVMTARDLALVAAAAFTISDIRTRAQLPTCAITVSGPSPRTMNGTNANRFINGPTESQQGESHPDCLGGKVGQWNDDGTHISLAQMWVAPSGHEIVLVVLNAESYRSLHLDHCAMIYGMVKDWPDILAGTVPADSDFGSVQLLLGGDGSIVDESLNARTLTVSGATVTDPVINSSGAILLGDSDSVEVTSTSSDFDIGAGDATFEVWFAGDGTVQETYFFANNAASKSMFMNQYDRYFQVFASSNGVSFTNQIIGNQFTVAEINTFFNGAPRHLAWVKAGSDIYGYINGERGVNTMTSISTIAAGNNAPSLGVEQAAGVDISPIGRHDEFRVTIGVARYTDRVIQLRGQKFSRAVDLEPEVSHTLNFSQTLIRVIDLDVESTLSFTQDADEGRIPVSNDLDLDHDVTPEWIFDRSVANTLALSDTVAETEVRELATSNTLALTQTYKRVLEFDVESNITFTHTPVDSMGRFNIITFSHSVGLALIVGKNLTSIATITQVVERETVLNKTVANNLVLTQDLKRILELATSNILAFSGTPGVTSSKPTDSDLNITHVASSDVARGRSRTSTLAFTQSATETEVRARSASNTLAMTQGIKLTFDRAEDHTITFVQNVNYVLSKTASNDLDFSHDVVEEHFKLRKLFANFEPTHTVDPEWVFDRSVSHTLAFTQSVRRVLDFSVTSTLAFTHSNTFVNTKNVTSTLALSQAVVGIRIYGRSVEQNLILSQTLNVQRVVVKNMLSIMRLSHRGRLIPIRNRTVDHTLPLTQELHREVFLDTTENTLDLTQEVVVKRLREFSVTHNLGLTQTAAKASVLNFNFAHNLSFYNFRVRDIRIGDLTQITIPNIIYSLTPVPPQQNGGYVTTTPTVLRQRQIMKISVPGRVVVLPVPLFGDKEGNTDQFTMSFAIDGEIYTTVKKSGTRTIGFEWDLAFTKAEELKEFVWDNNSKAMTIETWKGEIWVARMITNPVSFSDQLRPSLSESDSKVMVGLDFEGVRIH